MTKSLNVFEFNDYREFVRSWIEQAKLTKSSSLSKLAEVAQVHSTFLSHVLSGSKDLSLEQAALIGEHLEFTGLEQDYFFALIHLDRAGNPVLKKYWLSKKKEIERSKNKLSKRFENHKSLTEEQRTTFFSSWVYSAVFTATAIDAGQTLDQLAVRFSLSRPQMQDIVSFLVQSGLCEEKKGVITIGQNHLHIKNDSPHVLKHHMNWRMKAFQKMDFREPTELFFTSPMSVAIKDFDILREKLNSSIQELIDIAKDSDAEEVVCLNIDFFRLK
jgi:uncharacterized protein (TIGR02147 family)